MKRNVPSVWSLLIRLVSVHPALLITLYTNCVAHYTKGRPQIAAMKITSIVDPKLLVRNVHISCLTVIFILMYRND